MKATVYLREGQIVPVEQQRERIQAYAIREGIEIDGYFVEIHPASNDFDERLVLASATRTARDKHQVLLMDCVSRLAYTVKEAECLARRIRAIGVEAVATHTNTSITSDDPYKSSSRQFLEIITEYLAAIGPTGSIL